jgi:hypothetical protein
MACCGLDGSGWVWGAEVQRRAARAALRQGARLGAGSAHEQVQACAREGAGQRASPRSGRRAAGPSPPAKMTASEAASVWLMEAGSEKALK